MTAKKYVVKKAPRGLYQSWNCFHQQHPNLYVASLFVDRDERVLVAWDQVGKLWHLPNLPHQCFGDREGIFPAFLAMTGQLKLSCIGQPKSVWLGEVSESPVPDDPVFALIRADVAFPVQSSGLRWAASAEELAGWGPSHPIVMATARAGMPHSQSWEEMVMT